MAGKIEIRASGAKFRFVVLNRSGDKLMQSGQFDDKASAKRAASSLVNAVSGADITDATKPAAAPKPTAVATRRSTATRAGAAATKHRTPPTRRNRRTLAAKRGTSATRRVTPATKRSTSQSSKKR